MEYVDLIFCLVMVTIATRTSSAFRVLCNGKHAILPCPLDHPQVWKIKQYGRSLRTLSLNDPPRIVPRSVQLFRGDLKMTKDFSLEFAAFKPIYSGTYICINQSERVSHHVVSIQCELEFCSGDKAFIECGVLKYQRTPFTDMSWKDDKTTVLRANQDLQPKYVNPKYKGAHLSPNIPGALVVALNSVMDKKRFTCVIHDSKGVTPRRSTVRLKSIRCTKNITVDVNGTALLKCPYFKMLTRHPRASKLVWTKASRNVVTITPHDHVISFDGSSSNVSVSMDDGNILIESISEREQGTYTCSVLQRDGVVLARHSVTLRVTQLHKRHKMGNRPRSGSSMNRPSFLSLVASWVIVVIFYKE